MYEILRNRMTNGVPYLKQRALEEVQKIVLDITSEQADELIALANQGYDTLPDDAMARLEKLEQVSAEHDAAFVEIGSMIGGAV